MNEENEENAPLAGLRVVDLGQIYQGPYASFLLAMAGADVVKVEPPDGDRLRGGVDKAPNMAFAMLNSNKRSVTLDLKQPRGREIMIELAKRADIVLENFAPGVMDRLGVGARVLREANPRLIYASGTGYGNTGPDRDQLAMDHTVQAMGGMMSVTGFPGGPPLRAGGAVGDILGGVHLYSAITTALLRRERTGQGATVEVAMQESMYFSFASAYTRHHHTGEIPAPAGNGPLGAPTAPYNVYAARDGHIAIICVTDEHFQRVLGVIGRNDLIGSDRFATRADRGRRVDEVDALVEPWVAEQSRDDAYNAFREARVPCAPVRDLVELMHDPHMHERAALEWHEHTELGRVVLPRSPLRFDDFSGPELVSSPRAGEHNAEVYREWLALSGAQVSELQTSGVI